MSQPVARPVVRWRLGARTRKGVLLVDIASAGAWLGIDLVMGVLVVTALASDQDRTKALAFRRWSWSRSGRCSQSASSVCSAASCSAKAAATDSSGTGGWQQADLEPAAERLVLVALAPEVAAHADQARQYDAGLPAALGVDQLIFPPIVSPTALLVAPPDPGHREHRRLE
jgi:hypothetical protein